MMKTTSLLFLHGIGDGDPGDSWAVHLADALTGLGYSGLDGVQVIAPKYAHALKGSDEKEELPELTGPRLSREARATNRRNFESRTAAIEYRLGRHDGGSTGSPRDLVVDGGVLGGRLGAPRVVQAHNYIVNPQIRAQVLNRIISKLPTSGRLVIVGYSLGSVIAADLVSRLPKDIEVSGMITIGSPLANRNFDVDKLRTTLADPPTNLQWWVNFWNPADPVAAHRGVSSAFPWMIDFRIPTKGVLHTAHHASAYLSSEPVARAIGFATHGSLSRDVVRSENAVDIELSSPETLALLALRYAHLLRIRLEGDVQSRYAGALRQVQATLVSALIHYNESSGRSIPGSIARLDFDFADPDSQTPEPLPLRHLTREMAVLPLLAVASTNVIRPFEIGLPKGAAESAMADLTAEMGLGSPIGAAVFDSIKRAHQVVDPGTSRNWIRWVALGAGAAALVVATGGVALAAAPGVFGAAAITSALAAFGPGGMIGGLLTAGTLATAGGGGIAFGLASGSVSAEALEAVVESRLSAAILRQSQGFEADPSDWQVFVDIEVEVRREIERLDEFSDASAPSLKDLRRKLDTVVRAINYLRTSGLEPRFSDESADPAN